MINIFEVFLPQLLRYPNPTDPLNGEAAALLMREPKSYEAKVKGRSSSVILAGRFPDTQQSMSPNTPVKKPPTKLEQSQTMTMTCRQ